MRGLENIISQIKFESDARILEIESKAIQRAKEIVGDAEKEKEEILGEYSKIAEQKRVDIAERIKSSKKMELSNAILEKKQSIIKEITEKAKNKIKCLGQEEYFAFLLKMLEKFSLDEKGKILMAEDDVKRIPSSFKAQLKKRDLQVKEISQKKGNGFVLVYGNVEINCTVDELFQSAESEVCDLINELLFVR
ncbi:MAG: V-type ATP synthase subunit E [Clostridia bacterium]|nr:V-type ATP synthase subunit E [Clostridia bacterium]